MATVNPIQILIIPCLCTNCADGNPNVQGFAKTFVRDFPLPIV